MNEQLQVVNGFNLKMSCGLLTTTAASKAAAEFDYKGNMKSKLIAVLFLMSIAVNGWCETEKDSELLTKFCKRFTGQCYDLLQINLAFKPDEEDGSICNALENICDQWSVTTDFLSEECSLIETMASDFDKEMVRKFAVLRIKGADTSAQHAVTSINRRLGRIKKPGLATEAQKLKTNLNDLRELMEKILKRIEEPRKPKSD